MNVRTGMLAALFAATALAPALAQSPTPSTGEAGYIEPVPQLNSKVSSKPLASPEARRMKRGEVSPDGNWLWAGGERDWVLRSHQMRFEGWRLVHAETCPFKARVQ